MSSSSYTNLRYNKAHIHSIFEEIKHIDENGIQFWYARELMPILQYSNWQNFEKIIDKAKISCENSDVNVLNHFIDISKMVEIGSGAKRKQQDYKLSRYACYLIAQNGDSRKKVIALAQTYFAVQQCLALITFIQRKDYWSGGYGDVYYEYTTNNILPSLIAKIINIYLENDNQ